VFGIFGFVWQLNSVKTGVPTDEWPHHGHHQRAGPSTVTKVQEGVVLPDARYSTCRRLWQYGKSGVDEHHEIVALPITTGSLMRLT
jgi:hypothetical protein